MFSFPVQYMELHKSIQVTNKLMQEVPTQSGLYIVNGSTTAYNLMNEEFLRTVLNSILRTY